jgi:hypothetical protein
MFAEGSIDQNRHIDPLAIMRGRECGRTMIVHFPSGITTLEYMMGMLYAVAITRGIAPGISLFGRKGGPAKTAMYGPTIPGRDAGGELKGGVLFPGDLLAMMCMPLDKRMVWYHPYGNLLCEVAKINDVRSSDWKSFAFKGLSGASGHMMAYTLMPDHDAVRWALLGQLLHEVYGLPTFVIPGLQDSGGPYHSTTQYSMALEYMLQRFPKDEALLANVRNIREAIRTLKPPK